MTGARLCWLQERCGFENGLSLLGRGSLGRCGILAIVRAETVGYGSLFETRVIGTRHRRNRHANQCSVKLNEATLTFLTWDRTADC